MTVARSIEFVAEGRSDPGSVEKLTEDILLDLGIRHLADRKPAGLSGGEASLAAVARALAQKPRALLLDEPFSGLDADLRAGIREKVLGIARNRQLPILYVSHLREEVVSSVDRLAVLVDGIVAQCGGPAEVYSRPASAAVARLTGDVGLIVAEITAQNVVTPAGAFQRTRAPRAEQLGTGWKGLAAIRPESLKLAGDGNIIGTVLKADYYGGHYRLLIRVGGAGGGSLPVFAERFASPGSEVRLELRGDLALVDKD
jgi:ABC-type Fe3+/spermidine/putrescine transport system ATPase subunit